MKTHKDTEKITKLVVTKFFSEEVYEVADEYMIETLRQLNYIALSSLTEPGDLPDDMIQGLLDILAKEREDENRESLRSLGLY